MKPTLTAIAMVLLMASIAHCVPPAPGLSSEGMPKDSVHKNTDVSALIARGAPAWQVAKAIAPTGTRKVAVIFVYFTDVSLSTTDVTTYTDATNGYIKKMKDYYTECSYGALTLNLTLLTNAGVGYQVPHTMSYYGSNKEANVANGYLFEDACTAAGITKASNGGYDALLVVHAGTGEESTKVSSDIWSLFTDFPGNSSGFTEGETVPAKESSYLKPFGVLCHEFGHQLGLPDLYNTVSGAVNVGTWDIMDYGAWANNGDNPTHPSTWSKMQLGWITPVTVNSSSNVTINSFESGVANAYRLPVLGSSTEYFLLEFRKQAGMDSNLPGFGTLVWHIDDKIGTIALNDINTNSSHLRVALEEADKNGDLSSNQGDTGDPFKETSIFTAPQSDGYSLASIITVADFAGSASSAMTMRLSLIPATANLSIKKVFNFPNPVRNAAATTLRAVFRRPFTTASLKVFTISGEPVLNVPLTGSNLQSALSETNGEWTYDYIWNLTNDGGAKVGSGMYLYVIAAEISGDRQVKSGKLAILR
ncbi:MAG: M6 family metalloprotease domain-containing protein [Candidatus Firestonebacteria bacterium]